MSDTMKNIGSKIAAPFTALYKTFADNPMRAVPALLGFAIFYFLLWAIIITSFSVRDEMVSAGEDMTGDDLPVMDELQSLADNMVESVGDALGGMLGAAKPKAKKASAPAPAAKAKKAGKIGIIMALVLYVVIMLIAAGAAPQGLASGLDSVLKMIRLGPKAPAAASAFNPSTYRSYEPYQAYAPYRPYVPRY